MKNKDKKERIVRVTIGDSYTPRSKDGEDFRRRDTLLRYGRTLSSFKNNKYTYSFMLKGLIDSLSEVRKPAMILYVINKTKEDLVMEQQQEDALDELVI